MACSDAVYDYLDLISFAWITMTLKEYCDTLDKEELFKLATKCCALALPIWDKYADGHELTYRDTVVGLRHHVNRNLLNNSVRLGQEEPISKSLLDKMLYEFEDPIASIQDFDWELPGDVKCAFYAVYNLLTGINIAISVFGERVHYVSVNQACDAIFTSKIMTVDEVRYLIYGEKAKIAR